MNSGAVAVLWSILAQLPPPRADEPADTTYLLLTAIDIALAAAAVAVLARIAALRMRYPDRGLLISAPRRPNTVGETSIAAAVLVYFLGAVLLVEAFGRQDGTDNPARMLATGAAGHVIGGIACLVVAAQHFRGGLLRLWAAEGSTFAGSLRTGTIAALLGLGLCPLLHFLTVMGIRLVSPGYEPSIHPTLEALRAVDQPLGVIVLLWTSATIVAPIAEELFFRGLLQTYLTRITENRRAGIMIASIAFTLIHVGQPHAFPALLLLALILGYAYERTGTIAVPIAIHGLFNFRMLLWDRLQAIAT